MKIGFIGLGNVGGKLAGSLQRNGFALAVRDLERAAAQPFLDRGAAWAESPKAMAEAVDMVITCLPSPAASAAVMVDDEPEVQLRGPGQAPRRDGVGGRHASSRIAVRSSGNPILTTEPQSTQRNNLVFSRAWRAITFLCVLRGSVVKIPFG